MSEQAYLDIDCDLCGTRLDKQAKVKSCDLTIRATGERIEIPWAHTHLYHTCKENTTTVTFLGKQVTSARAYRFYCPKHGWYWGGDRAGSKRIGT